MCAVAAPTTRQYCKWDCVSCCVCVALKKSIFSKQCIIAEFETLCHAYFRAAFTRIQVDRTFGHAMPTHAPTPTKDLFEQECRNPVQIQRIRADQEVMKSNVMRYRRTYTANTRHPSIVPEIQFLKDIPKCFVFFHLKASNRQTIHRGISSIRHQAPLLSSLRTPDCTRALTLLGLGDRYGPCNNYITHTTSFICKCGWSVSPIASTAIQ